MTGFREFFQQPVKLLKRVDAVWRGSAGEYHIVAAGLTGSDYCVLPLHAAIKVAALVEAG
jgi:hypothetical protein